MSLQHTDTPQPQTQVRHDQAWNTPRPRPNRQTVPSSPMSRRELAVASHSKRERTIGLAKPTYGTTAALLRAFAAGGHVTNRPCRGPCACMLPEAIMIATVLARPGHEPSRQVAVDQSSLDNASASLHNCSFSINSLKLQSIRSVERTRSRSPDETLPTHCHAPTSCSGCPSRCHPLSLST